MKKLIAVVGMSGTGKSVATTYLEDQGYKKIYFGGVIYDKMKEAGIEITPDSQKEFRENLRKEHGMGVVAKIFKDLKLICVCTDKKIRYNRVESRPDRPFNHEDIIKRDVAEIENSAKGGPIAFADYYILNNGDLNSFYKRLEEILDDIDNE